MKRRYKMLNLSSPFLYESAYWEDCVKNLDKIDPVFNRNGFFLDRKTGQTWIEVNGEAWKYDNKNGFLWKLSRNIGNNRIHPDVYKALEIVLRAGLGDARLREVYLIENDMRLLHNGRVEANLGARQFFKNYPS